MLKRSLQSDQRQTRLSSWPAPALDDELVVVGAVDGAGVAALDVELAEPVADAVVAAASGCADDMAYTVLSITGKWGYVCRWTKKLVGGVVIIEAEFPKDEWPPLETVRVVGVVRRFEAQS